MFPYPHDGIIDCESFSAPLKPQETYEKKFLLNHRFDLTKPGKYDFVISLQTGTVRSGQPDTQARGFQTRKLKLVLRPSTEAALKAVYQPYFDALKSEDSPNRLEALRALADSGQAFVEAELLRFSSDPRSGSDFQNIANEGLARLRTPAACARLAELADHPESHH
ncbi:MAG TPA: HEAT repeat domain-containing protein [Terriglobales bacterium]